MKAKKKKIDTVAADDLGIDLDVSFANVYFLNIHKTLSTIFKLHTDIHSQPKNKVLEVFEPPARKEGIVVEDIDTLLDKLRNEAGAIQ